MTPTHEFSAPVEAIQFQEGMHDPRLGFANGRPAHIWENRTSAGVLMHSFRYVKPGDWLVEGGIFGFHVMTDQHFAARVKPGSNGGLEFCVRGSLVQFRVGMDVTGLLPSNERGQPCFSRDYGTVLQPVLDAEYIFITAGSGDSGAGPVSESDLARHYRLIE